MWIDRISETGEPLGDSVHASPFTRSQLGETVLSWRSISPIHATDHVELSGIDSSPPTEIENGQLAYHFGTIFMKDTVSKAKAPVNLHTRGITLEPGSEAKLYLANQQGLLIPCARSGGDS